jgi:hypothetical protein
MSRMNSRSCFATVFVSAAFVVVLWFVVESNASVAFRISVD